MSYSSIIYYNSEIDIKPREKSFKTIEPKLKLN